MQRAAYDDLPDGVLVADAAGRVVELNAAAERLLGTGRAQALGRDYREVLPLRDERGRDWWTCTDPYAGLTTRTRQAERRLDHPSGRTLLVTATFVRDGQRRLERLVVGLRDDRARERLDRDRADLVATVAHELRTPLASVKGFTATLLARWDRFDDGQRRQLLETVHADAARVTTLLAELLDVGRIEAGRLQVRRQVVDVPAALRRAVAGRVAAGDAADRFVMEVAGPLPEVWVDPGKLDQVVGNLLDNAVRHGAGTVTVTLRPAGDGLELLVADEGEGVAPEAAARVFTRFWRGRRSGGSGLGLYLVKGLVEAHGGSVQVRSAPSGGAVFRVLLPVAAPDLG